MSITLEEAIAIAKKADPEVDSCFEYSTMYVFQNAEKAAFSIGGTDMPFAGMKDTGKVRYGYSQIVLEIDPEEYNSTEPKKIHE